MSEGVASIGSCMSFSASAPATPVDPAVLTHGDFAALTDWTKSGEVTNIGDIGAENEVITYNTVCNGKVNKRLGATNFGQQALTLAYKSANGAQALLSSAVKSKVQISVRETLSSGDVLYYIAYVASVKTQVGGSSDFLRAAVTLEVDSEIVEELAT